MFKIILTYKNETKVQMRRFLASDNALPAVLSTVGHIILSYTKNGATITDCTVTNCNNAELEQIGAEILNDVKSMLRQHPEVVAVTRDTCPLYVTNQESTINVYVKDMSESTRKLKQQLLDFYNIAPYPNEYCTVVKIKYAEEPDLTEYKLVSGVDF